VREVRFKGQDFGGCRLLEALRYLTKGKLDLKLGRGADDTKPSKEQKND
jgi:hypothetical protein